MEIMSHIPKDILSCILILVLLVISYQRLQKLFEEETSISITFMKNEVHLPSLTICNFPIYSNLNQTNMTFQEFMDGSLSVKDSIIGGSFEYMSNFPDEE